MGARKIRDETEVLRWYEEGVTFDEMAQRYREKYNVEVTWTMFSNWRRRAGLPNRIVRDDELIPWAVKLEHRHHRLLVLLRIEARRRAGRRSPARYARRAENLVHNLRMQNLVVAYDPATKEGFSCVPARPGIDTDLIRVPDQVTGRAGHHDA